MRRSLVALTLAPLLALALPACLSGFSEIRIARFDAGTVDVARVDAPQIEDASAPADADAPSGPEDALDATSALDVPAPSLDAPEAAVPVDIADLDAQDARAVLVDVQDAPAEDRAEAGDAGDGGGLDVQCPVPLCDGRCVDTSSDPANCGACGMACAGGVRCVGGQCLRLAGVLAVDPERFRSTPDPREEWQSMCRAAHPGSRVCRYADVWGTVLRMEICRLGWHQRARERHLLAALGEAPVASPDGGATRYACTGCATVESPSDHASGCTEPDAIPCCAP